MKSSRIAAATAIALVFGIGAGAAWAQTSGDNGPEASTSAGGTPLAWASGTSEAEYVAITPCRLVDTRQAGGQLQVGGARAFAVRGSGSAFANQGGKAGGCGIPSSATAVEATVTAIDSGSGFLRLWPAGEGQPNATYMNYDDAFNVSNTGAVTLCGAPCVANQDLNARAYGTATQLVIDVQGYYEDALVAVVDSAGAISRSSRVSAVNRSGPGQYAVAFTREVNACSYSVTVGNPTSGGSNGYATATPRVNVANSVFIQTFNSDGQLNDQGFSLVVTC